MTKTSQFFDMLLGQLVDRKDLITSFPAKFRTVFRLKKYNFKMTKNESIINISGNKYDIKESLRCS